MGAVSSSPEQQPIVNSAKKHIFVASSWADLELAQEVAEFLSGLEGVQGECWKEQFPLGLLTFEALEQMLQRCLGAVFVMSAANLKDVNNNVMIELGLVAGRMGRARVAIYTVGDVQLPSDLAGISCIQNGNREEPGEEQTDHVSAIRRGIPSNLAMRLSEWTDSLPAIMTGFPLTSVLHGYSGHWKAALELDTWHSKPVGKNMVALNCDLLLHIPPNGRNGIGIGSGRVIIHWQPDKSREELYQATFHVCLSVSDVTCERDGGMTFRTETLIRQLAFVSGGRTLEPEFSDELPAHWIIGWKLTPRPFDVGLDGRRLLGSGSRELDDRNGWRFPATCMDWVRGHSSIQEASAISCHHLRNRVL
jgi:Predicted nucleotide-binding protein containing TIR-like domain